MPNIEANPEITQQTIDQRFAEIAAAEEALLPVVEVIPDQEGFERRIFTFVDMEVPTGFTFRGKEELPKVGSDDVTHVVLTDDRRPLHTGSDRYGKWAHALVGADHSDLLLGRPDEPGFEGRAEKVWHTALEEESAAVLFHTQATPEGVVDAAIQLIRIGQGDAARYESLKELRIEISERKHGPHTLELLDRMYVATAIPSEFDGLDDEIRGHAIEDMQADHQNGLMELALELAGEAKAKEIIDKKSQMVVALESIHLESGVLKEQVRTPGDKLTAEELEKVKKAHLVGVHTTVARPIPMPGAKGIVRTTSEFNKDSTAQRFRDSLHFSLNHPVESHIMGSFDERPFTVISPVDKLMEYNGAPAVLFGVDTYFMGDVGGGVVLPPETTILEMHTDAHRPAIDVTNGEIAIKAKDYTVEDIKQIAQAYTVRVYGEQLVPDTDAVEYMVSRLSRNLISTHEIYKAIHDPMDEAQLQQYREIQGEDWYKTYTERQELCKFLGSKMIPGEARHESERHVIDVLLEIVKSDELLEKFPALDSALAGALRRCFVQQEIVRQGGEVVQSDGMSAYIETPGFDNKVIDLAKELGVRSGLHQNQAESSFERAYGDAIRPAIVSVEVPGSSEARRGDFDWTKYRSAKLWRILIDLPPQVRHRAMEAGLLTFASKELTTNQDSDLW